MTVRVVWTAQGHHSFDTVLGTIGFDDKGDVTGYDTFVWYQWRNGDYAPVGPSQLSE